MSRTKRCAEDAFGSQTIPRLAVLFGILAMLLINTIATASVIETLDPKTGRPPNKTFQQPINRVNPESGASDPQGLSLYTQWAMPPADLPESVYADDAQMQTTTGPIRQVDPPVTHCLVERQQVTLCTQAAPQSVVNRSEPVIWIRGRGLSAGWLQRVVKPGMSVSLDTVNNKILFEQTPWVTLLQAQHYMNRAQSLMQRSQPTAYAQQRLQSAKIRCQALIPLGYRAYESEAQLCLAEAEKAYFAAFAPKPSEFRGVWIRPTRQAPEAIGQWLDQYKALGIDHVFLETYFQGKTTYPSTVMAQYGLPIQHEQFRGQDPVQVWVSMAHDRGMKAHAWMQTFFAGNAHENVEPNGPILNKYPQWANVPRFGIKQGKPVPSVIENGHYFLDPANPEVQTFLTALFTETLTQYPFDGLNLDYIRYAASSKPGTSQFLSSSWGYSPYARQQFKQMIDAERWAAQKAAEEKQKQALAKQIDALKKAGKPIPASLTKPPADKNKEKPPAPPPSDPAEFTESSPYWKRWVAWRKQHVSNFVQSITAKARAINPTIMVTAVTFPDAERPSDGASNKLQDYKLWLSQKWVDALTPIGLNANPANDYQALMRDSTIIGTRIGRIAPVYVGIFALYYRTKPEDLLLQIDAVRKAGLEGIMLFDGGRLTPDYQDALSQGTFRQQP